ncbi:semaphorin-4F [Latimeria chalumnae]|uniref:semaphorin-4F n=1 Tax=Latimeria chalumnae TaxID=7897 RepID=UPI00313BFB32
MECYNYIRFLDFINETHIFACGTYAFDPHCIFINVKDFDFVKKEDGEILEESGRGKCPFKPTQQFAAVMVEGIMYAATVINFLGTEPIISRTTGNPDQLIRTEATSWLSDPDFVGSAFVRESENSAVGDDDKIYFFFTETAPKVEFYEKVRVASVARVCKGDLGGQKTLQKRWTTFLKTRLICRDPSTQILFNVITEVFTLQVDPSDWRSTIFYGIFTSQWEKEEVSAICSYSLKDIIRALDGPFKEYKRECDKWTPYSNTIPSPRPGSCITTALREEGYTSSLELPDKVLTFVRDHPLMDTPVNEQTFLIKMGTRYTKIMATNVRDLSGESHTILVLGTDKGHLHRAVHSNDKTVILEDVALFEDDQPIQNLQLHQGFLYVGSPVEVVKLPIENCWRYRTCQECILAQDPLCGWDTDSAKCTKAREGMSLLQDVTGGHTRSLCSPAEGPSVSAVSVISGNWVVLPCVPPSTWSICSWTKPLAGNQYKYRSNGLEFMATDDAHGNYDCNCTENGVNQLVASYIVEVVSTSTVAKQRDSRSHNAVYAIIFFFLGLAAGATLCYVIIKRKLLCSSTVGGSPKQEKNGFNRTQTPESTTEAKTPSSPGDSSLLLENDKRIDFVNGFSGIYVNVNEVPSKTRIGDAPLASVDESSI